MNHDQTDGLSRRMALQRGLGAITGAALAGMAGSAAWSATARLSKSAVQYVDAGKDEGKDCDDCAHFVPGKTGQANGTCRIVEGSINPHGHCVAFKPKPKST